MPIFYRLFTITLNQDRQNAITEQGANQTNGLEFL